MCSVVTTEESMDLKEVMYYFLIRFIFYDVLEYAKFFLSLFGFCSTLIDFGKTKTSITSFWVN